MSRQDRNAQKQIIYRIQTVICSIDGYQQSNNKPTCMSKNNLCPKNNWLQYRNMNQMGSWNTIKTTPMKCCDTRAIWFWP